MARTTIVFGVALVVLGIGGYVGTGSTAITALIPAVFGLVLGGLGAVALNEGARKHAMHAAAMLGVVGFLVPLVHLLSVGRTARPGAVIAQSIMAVLMAAFVGLCVRSFIAARRARTAQVKLG